MGILSLISTTMNFNFTIRSFGGILAFFVFCLPSIQLLAQGCPTITDSISIRQNVTCVSGNNGKFQFVGKGGVAPYSYTLSTISGDVTNSTGLFENLVAKDYRIKITDANGCIGTFIRRIESFTDLNTLNNSMLSYDWLADSVASSASNTYTYLTDALPALKVNGDSLAQYGAGNLNAVSKYIPIGFSFKMDNFYYDSLVIAEDGVVSFNKNINTTNYSLNQWYQNLFYTGLNTYSSPVTGESCQCDTAYLDNPLPFIAPLRDDIQANTSGAVPSQIVYKLSGTAPNRVFAVEWRNMRWNRVCNVQRDNSVSFQLELFEGSNNVKFHYKAEPNLKVNNCGGDFMGDFSTVVGYDYSAGLFGRRLGGGNYIALNPDSTKLFTNSPNVVTDAGVTTLYRGVKTDNRNFPSAIGYPYGKHYEFISPPTGSCVDPLSIVSVQTTPSSGSSGTITITATGGLRKSDRYFYSKDGGKTFRQGSIPAAGTVYRDTFNNLPPGTYRIAVMDNQIFQISESGTPISQSFIIQTVDVPELKIDSIIDNNISCNGLSDGKLTFKWTKTSPTGTYNVRFEKSDGTGVQTFTGLTDTIKQFTGLNANTYKITVTFNDYGLSATATETLASPSNVTFTSAPTTAPTCFGGADGQMTMNVAGGTGTYMYSVDNGATFQSSNNFTNLTAGSYTIKAKDSNGCLAVTSPTVSVANGTQVTIFSLAKNNADCKGTSTGDIFIRPDIGTRPFTYSANNGATFQVDSFFKNIPAGIYPLKIKDANGCLSATTNLTINEPADFVTFTTSNTNISCASTTASITVTASGGTGVFQFSSNNGTNFTNSPSTPNPYTFTNLTAGTYRIKVRDANGCLAGPTDVVLSGTTAPTITLNSKTDVRCNGSQSGVFNITVSGGALPYSVVVKNSSNTVIPGIGSNPYNYPDLAADTYTITVTDGNSCVATQSVNITQPDLFYATVSGTNVSCNGGSDGTITLTANGGVSPYQFSKDNGVTYVSSMTSSNTFTGLTAGTYLLKVKDANNCIGSTGRVLTEPTAISVNDIAVSNVVCNGGTGQIVVSASGGTAPLTYSINGVDFVSSNTFTGLNPNTYTVTVKDNQGCTKVQNTTITEPSVINVSTTKTEPSCNGGTGSITVTASGGTGALRFSKDNGATYSTGTSPYTFSAVTPSNYQIKVKDANDCESAATSVSINQPPPLSITSTDNTIVTCFDGNDGSITVTASGGTGALQFSKDNGVNYTSGTSPYTFSGLTAGTYALKVKDASNCETMTTSVTVSEPAEVIVTLVQKIDIKCKGDATGEIEVDAEGGRIPGDYHHFTISGSSVSNDDGIFTGLKAGNYTITATDDYGCEGTINVTLTEPTDPLSIGSVSTTAATCATGGTVSVTGTSGGTSPYSFALSASLTNTTGSFTNVAAGGYTLTVTDANNCTTTQSVTVSGSDVSAISINSQTNIVCKGAATGSFAFSVSGGTGAYTVLVKNAANSTMTGTGSNPYTYANLAAGTYTISVTDAASCSTSQSVILTEPTTLLTPAIDDKTTAGCTPAFNATAMLSATGGVSPYTFELNGTTNSTGSFTNLLAGNYTATVTDNLGCEQTINLDILSSPAVTAISETHTNITCNNANDGTITWTPTGGTTPFTFTITGGASNATGSFTGLSAGTYSLTYTDAKGCKAAGTPASVTIVNPDPLSIDNVSTTPATCGGGGTVSATASGGTGTYTFALTPSLSNTTGNFTNLAAGNYILTVTDAKNCSTTANLIVGSSTAPSIKIGSQTDIACYGGSTGLFTFSISGGTGAYTVSVKDGSNNTVSYSGSNPYTVSILAAGTYTISVTDAATCSATQTVTLTQPSTPLSITTTSKTNVTANGGTDGTITVTASGGTGALQFSKDNGVNYVAGTSPFIFNSLAANTYQIKVKDANNCETAATSVTVSEPDALSFTTSQVNILCNGATTGSITITPSGGVSPYTYSKDDGANYSTGTSPFTFSSLAANTYKIKVKDANNIETNATSVVITEPTPLSITMTSKTDVACNGGNNGSITVTASGGTGALQFSKDDGANYTAGTSPFTFNSLTANTYKIKVKDANNCETTASSVTVGQPSPLSIGTVSTTPATCATGGTVTITGITGGTIATAYTFNLSASLTNTTGSFTNIASGNYTLTVTDDNGCSATKPVNVSSSTAPAINLDAKTDVLCKGGSTGAFTFSISGGTSPFTTVVKDASNNAISGTGSNPYTYANLVAGTYIFTVTDNASCTASQSVTLTEPTVVITPSVSIAITTGSDDVCAGTSVTFTATPTNGGTTPSYQWRKNGSPVGTNAATYTDATLAGGDIISCDMTSSETCAVPSTTISNTITMKVIPTTVIISGTTTACSTVTLMANTVNNSLSLTYAWSGGSTPTSAINTFTISGTYIVTVTDGATGCSGTKHVVVTVNPTPRIISIQAIAPSFQGDNNGRIILTTEGGTDPKVYSWVGVNGYTSSVQNPANLSTGNYSVTLTDANGCQAFGSISLPDGAPIMSCPPAVTININQLNGSDAPLPSVTGQLTTAVTFNQITYTDQIYDVNCGVVTSLDGSPANINYNPNNTGDVVRIFVRLFKATNTNSTIGYYCSQMVYVRSYKLTDVNVPTDQVLQCANSATNPSVTGVPSVDGRVLGQGFVKNLSSNYMDERISNANGFTIKRTWILKNECTGEISTVVQNLTYTEGSCPSATFSISGKIRREDLMDVPAKVVVLNTASGLQNSTTSASYNFTNLLANNRYQIRPDRPNTDWNNGVTTFDIAMISRHVLGVSSLATPYQMIAADVNRSGEVDATDMLLIQKLILHLNESFPNNNSWRFVSKNYQFQDPSNPFASDFPESLIIPNLTNTVANGDFVAIKVGDVNGSLGSASIRGGVAPFILNVEDKVLEKGKIYEIPIRMTSSVTALQYALSVDKSMAQIVNITKGDLPNANDNNFGLFKNEGIVTAVWYQNAHQKLGETDTYTMFNLTIKPTTNTRLSEILSLNPVYTEGVAYDQLGKGAAVKLSFGNTNKSVEKLTLLTNYPNPFSDETTISFILPKDAQVRLTITSVDGKLMKEVKGEYKAGYNRISVNKSDLNASGIFYYRLETTDHSASKKMVIMD